MYTKEELIQSPEYWFTEAQSELFRQLVNYMEHEKINRTELAERLGVTKGYVSQTLNGNFNFTLRKLIETSLAIGLVPKIEYTKLSDVINAVTPTYEANSVPVKNQPLVIPLYRPVSSNELTAFAS